MNAPFFRGKVQPAPPLSGAEKAPAAQPGPRTIRERRIRDANAQTVGARWGAMLDDAIWGTDAEKRKAALAEWARLPAERANLAGERLCEDTQRRMSNERPARASLSEEGRWALREMLGVCAHRGTPFSERTGGDGLPLPGWISPLLRVGAGAGCVKTLKIWCPMAFSGGARSRSLPAAMEMAVRTGAHPAVIAEIARHCGFEQPPKNKPFPPETEPAGIFWRLVAQKSAQARNFKALVRFAQFMDLRAESLGGASAFSRWVVACAAKCRLDSIGSRRQRDWAHEADGSGPFSLAAFWPKFRRLSSLANGLPPAESPAAHREQNRAVWILARQARQSKPDPDQAAREQFLGSKPQPDALQCAWGIQQGGEERAEIAEWIMSAKDSAPNQWPPQPWDDAEARLWAETGVNWPRANLGSSLEGAAMAASVSSRADAVAAAKIARALAQLVCPTSLATRFRPWRHPELIAAQMPSPCLFNAAMLLATREIYEEWQKNDRAGPILLDVCAQIQARKDYSRPEEMFLVDSMEASKKLSRSLSEKPFSMGARSEMSPWPNVNWWRDPTLTEEQHRFRFSSDFDDRREQCFAQSWSLWEQAVLRNAARENADRRNASATDAEQCPLKDGGRTGGKRRARSL